MIEQTTPEADIKTSQDFAYLKGRLEGQRKWHSDKANLNKKGFYALEITTLAAGALIPIINVLSIPENYLRILSALFGAIVAVSVGVSKLFKFQETWLSYRALSEALKREQELFVYGVGDYDIDNVEQRCKTLVERVENMLASMTSQYVSLHKAERERSAELAVREKQSKDTKEADQKVNPKG